MWRKDQVPLTETGVVTFEAESMSSLSAILIMAFVVYFTFLIGAMEFQYVCCVPGDFLFFSGYLPHRR